MKIKDLQVDGFGVWKGLNVDSLSDNVTVFYGQNEAGKTTLMQFIRSMMFGFSPDRREKYTPPVYGGLAGGSAEVFSNLGNFEIERHVDPNRLHDAIGDLSVTDAGDGTVHGKAKLSNILSDIDESIFNNVFAIGLREIQELNALNSTDASDMLYKLTSGMDRVSLVDVMRDLKQRRERLLGDDESRLTVLTQRKHKLLREIDELLARSKRWSRIAAESNAVDSDLEELAQKLTRLERESRLFEIAMQITDRWRSRNLLTEQINAFGKLPDPRDISVQKARRAQCQTGHAKGTSRSNSATASRDQAGRHAIAHQSSIVGPENSHRSVGGTFTMGRISPTPGQQVAIRDQIH